MRWAMSVVGLRVQPRSKSATAFPASSPSQNLLMLLPRNLEARVARGLLEDQGLEGVPADGPRDPGPGGALPRRDLLDAKGVEQVAVVGGLVAGARRVCHRCVLRCGARGPGSHMNAQLAKNIKSITLRFEDSLSFLLMCTDTTRQHAARVATVRHCGMSLGGVRNG
jgi:hypothetical protein